MTAYLFLIALSFQQPETLSLLERPLYPPSVPKAERARLEGDVLVGKQQIAHEPTNVDAVLGVSRAEMALGRVRDGIETLTHAVEAKADPRLFLDRGHGFIVLRKFDLAERDFRKAVEGIPAANCNLGLALYLLGDFARAADAYKQCPEPGFFGYLAARRNGAPRGTPPSPPPDPGERDKDIKLPGSVASKPDRPKATVSETYVHAVEEITEGRPDAAKQLLKPLVEKNDREWMQPIYIAAESDYARLTKNDPKKKRKAKNGKLETGYW
jgi:tetratricopeptide (TPR) repeat protein